MAISILFRGNLRKMSQQICVKSWQNCNFGLIWAVSGPPGSPIVQKKIIFGRKF